MSQLLIHSMFRSMGIPDEVMHEVPPKGFFARRREVRVNRYEFDPLIKRVMAKDGWSEERARRVFEDLKQFLLLCAETGRGKPTEEVDVLWHHFILYMKEYERFSKKVLGQVIYHTPL